MQVPAWDLESKQATQRLKCPSGIICGNGAEAEGWGVARCPGVMGARRAAAGQW